ncbi:MAG: AtpZ/AtpI family protein [Candidatus Moranbacteria bacterium]|nr:AtpZ/AtpI family protein [Candidatus Moranbacteria bacterium]
MKEESKKDSWSAVGFAWELGYSIAIPLVIFTLGGRLLDKKFGTSPWLLLIGLFLSIIVTFYIVYKKLMDIIRSEERMEKPKIKNNFIQRYISACLTAIRQVSK